MMNDHAIPLDELLADAAAHLEDQGMLAMASAVEVARARLLGGNAVESTTRLVSLCPDPDSQVQLSLAAVM